MSLVFAPHFNYSKAVPNLIYSLQLPLVLCSKPVSITARTVDSITEAVCSLLSDFPSSRSSCARLLLAPTLIHVRQFHLAFALIQNKQREERKKRSGKRKKK